MLRILFIYLFFIHCWVFRGLRPDGSSVGFEAASFGWAGGSVSAEGSSILPLSTPVFSSEPTLLSSLSDIFSATDAASAHKACQGGKKRAEGESGWKFKGLKV